MTKNTEIPMAFNQFVKSFREVKTVDLVVQFYGVELTEQLLRSLCVEDKEYDSIIFFLSGAEIAVMDCGEYIASKLIKGLSLYS